MNFLEKRVVDRGVERDRDQKKREAIDLEFKQLKMIAREFYRMHNSLYVNDHGDSVEFKDAESKDIVVKKTDELGRFEVLRENLRPEIYTTTELANLLLDTYGEMTQ